MRITHRWAVLGATLALLLVPLLAGEVFASSAVPGLRIIRSTDMSTVELGPGGGQILQRYLLPGVVANHGSNALTPVLRTIAGKDTAGAGTSARTLTVPAAFSDSLHKGGVARNLQFLVYCSTANHVKGGTLIITGTNALGAALIDSVTITDNTVLHTQTTKCFWSVTTILFPAMDNVAVRLYVGRGYAFGSPATTCTPLRIFRNGIPLALVAADSIAIHARDLYRNYWKYSWHTGASTLDVLYFVPQYQGYAAKTKW